MRVLRPTAWLSQGLPKAVKWENEFKCEGVSSLADFSALVSELEALDPVTVAVRPGNRRPDGWMPNQLLPPNVLQIAKRLDGLLDLLDATADGLTAAWDQVSREDTFEAGENIRPTIQ
jgi:hypothetical protein